MDSRVNIRNLGTGFPWDFHRGVRNAEGACFGSGFPVAWEAMNPSLGDGRRKKRNSPSLENRARALWEEAQVADQDGRGKKVLQAIAQRELQADPGAGLEVVEKLLDRIDQAHRLDLYDTLLGVLGRVSFPETGASVRSYWIGRKAHRTGDYRTAEQTYKEVLTASAGELPRKARTLDSLGHLYFEMGRFGLAERLYRQAVRTFRRAEDKAGLASSYRHLSELFRRQRRWEASLRYSRKALVLLQPQGASHTVGRLLLNTGIIYRIKGQWGPALAHFQQAHGVFRGLQDGLGTALALQQQGRTYFFRGDWDQALYLTKESLRKLQDLRSDGEICTTLRNLGEIYLALGDLRQAEHHLRVGLALSQKRDDLFLGAQFRSCLGQVCKAQEDFPQALEHFKVCLTMMENIGEEHGIGWVLCEVARLHQERGQFREAIRCAERSLAIMRFYQNRYRQVEVLLVLCSLLENTQSWDRIEKYLKEAKRYVRRLGYTNHQGRLAVLEGRLQLRRGRVTQA